jgi:DNA-binding beta-propeller fold protein YncE
VPATFAKVSSGERRGFALNGYYPLVLGGALALAAAAIFQWAGPAAPVSIVAWLLSLAAAVVVYRMATSLSWQAAGQVAAVGLFAAMIPFTLRAAGNAAYDQGNDSPYPREIFIYAQGAPTLGAIVNEIERVSETSGLGRDLPVVIDNSINIWPWPWYMRDHPYQVSNFDTDFTPPAGAVVLISQAKQDKMQPYLDDYYEGIPYRHMWWFPEFYRGLEPGEFIIDALSLQYLSTWRGYFIDRTVPNASDPPDMVAYFPKSFEAPIVEPPEIPGEADALPEDAVTQVAGPGADPGQVSQPGDMWVDSDGRLYVVDTMNHRVQRLSEDGSTWETVGDSGSREGEFGNPYDQDENFPQDGPWGIGVDAEGNIYVADTWNHRVQVFNADLEYVREWGAGIFFGPRDVAVDDEGNVLVVDTGNKRVVKFTPEGEEIQVYGRGGDGPLEFNEPSSIFLAPNGDIYVADYWNKRIQIFDSQFRYRDEIEIDTWGSPGITDRAYILALADGHVLATDPGNGRILVFDAAGEEIAAWRIPSAAGTTRPVGLAVDALGRVYISDGLNSRIVLVPLPELLTPPAPSEGG